MRIRISQISHLGHRRGFTMMEIVIALSILALIMTVSFGAITSMARSKKLLDDQRALRSVGDAILTRMVRELQLASSEDPVLPSRENPSEVVPQNLTMRGESKKIDTGEHGDSIIFMAREGGQYLPDGGGHAGTVQISYRLERNPEAQDDRGAPYFFIREETPNVHPAKSAYERAMVFPITENVIGLTFRYYHRDQKKWLDEWGKDSSSMKIPEMIEFTVKMRSPEGRIESFSTAVPLRKTP